MNNGINPSIKTGKEIYGEFDTETADAFVARLNEANMEEEGTIEVTRYEKRILFEILRASTELNIPGNTLRFDIFERNFAVGKIKWGLKRFKVVE